MSLTNIILPALPILLVILAFIALVGCYLAAVSLEEVGRQRAELVRLDIEINELRQKHWLTNGKLDHNITATKALRDSLAALPKE